MLHHEGQGFDNNLPPKPEYNTSDNHENGVETKDKKKSHRVGKWVAGATIAGLAAGGVGFGVHKASEQFSSQDETTSSANKDPKGDTKTAESAPTQEADPLSPEVIESTDFADRSPEQLKLSYEITVDEYTTPEKATERYFELETGFLNSGNNHEIEEYLLDQINKNGIDNYDDYFYDYTDKYNDVFTESSLFTNEPIHPDYKQNIAEYKDTLTQRHNIASRKYNDHKGASLDGDEPDYRIKRQVTDINSGKFDTISEDGKDYVFQSVTVEYETNSNGYELTPTEGDPNPGEDDNLRGTEVLYLIKTTVDGKEIWQIANVGAYGEN